jgi:BMFP domain-containing protein YqiC
MKNRELFVLDPVENKLLNDGVAEINTDKTNDSGQKIIKYELKTFVCEGEYEQGLHRILSTYIKNINEPMQPAVWVSGFFGSGKSHLVKMLGYLWEDFEFSTGETARNIKTLPTLVNDDLVELNKFQKINGKVSIAGTLKDFPSNDIRYSFLQFFLKGLGLPSQFHHFKFVHWLKQEGIYNDLKNYTEAQGRDFKNEYQNLFVSPYISKGILEIRPDFAENEFKVKDYLRANFNKVDTISREDLIKTMKEDVIPTLFDQMPCILIVLDEVQQFIGSDVNKTIEVQNLAQDLSNNFDGKLLFVATGQNSLSETPYLQPLQARFSVKVMLSDQDVETVTRKTVLEKKPTVIKDIKGLLDKASGEVARNMQNTAFAYESKDATTLVADYPILPSTRKLWKKLLAVLDTAGTQGQLRSQLRIVDESVKKIAEFKLGQLVPGDFIYEQKEQQLLQNSMLLNDTYNLIVSKKNGDAEEKLQGRILSVAFLLDQLPNDLPGGSPKANKETFADILVIDLTLSSDNFRKQVSEAVDKLVDEKLLMPIGNEFRLQTKAGQEWEKEYSAQVQKLISQGEDKIQEERNSRMMSYYQDITKGIRLNQGYAKVPRDIHLHFGSQKPITDTKINIWIRDGWMENEQLVLDEIRREGTDSPLSYAYIKKQRDEDLKNEIRKYISAKQALEIKGIPSDAEGQQARRSMETRMENAEEDIKSLIDRIANDADIYLAGGTSIKETTPKASVETALKQVMDRQFSEFKKADNANWPQALRSALNKAPNPLEKVGHKSDLNDHSVASSILRFMANSQVSGRDLRNNFLKASFGWPQDAIDTVIIALVNAEFISSSEDPLVQGKIGVATFKKETHTLTVTEKISLRKMFTAVGIPCAAGEEFKKSNIFLNKLKELAAKISGASPLPEKISTQFIEEILFRDGNERLAAIVYDIKNLQEKYFEWESNLEIVDDRLPLWEQLNQLVTFGEGEEFVEMMKEVEAIDNNRLLLQDPDLIKPLLEKITGLLKTELNILKENFNLEYDKRMNELQKNSFFLKLTPDQKNHNLRENQLLNKPEIKDYNSQALLNSLNKTPLDAWKTKISALGSQFDNALSQAVILLEPKAESYSVPRKTLSSQTEIDTYIDELKAKLTEVLKNAKSIILK